MNLGDTKYLAAIHYWNAAFPSTCGWEVLEAQDYAVIARREAEIALSKGMDYSECLVLILSSHWTTGIQIVHYWNTDDRYVGPLSHCDSLPGKKELLEKLYSRLRIVDNS